MAINQNLVNTYDEMLGRGQDKRGEALVKGSLSVLQQAAKDEIEAKKTMQKEHDKLQEKMIGLGNIGKLSAEEQKIAKQWLRGQRDEYSNLSNQYIKTKNPEVKDRMDEILASISNADSQIKLYNKEVDEFFLGSVDEKTGKRIPSNVAVGSRSFNYDFYKRTYGKDGSNPISFDPSGNMGFGGGEVLDFVDQETFGIKPGEEVRSKPKMLNDIYGQWNEHDAIVSTYARDQFDAVQKLKFDGEYYSKNKYQNDFYDKLKTVGDEGIQVFAEHDMTGSYGDEEGLNGSFVSRWEAGLADESMYTKFKKEDGADWMFDDSNADYLAKLMAKDFANITEDHYINSKAKGSDWKNLQGSAEERDRTRKLNQTKEKFRSVVSPEDHIEFFNKIGMKVNPVSKQAYEFSYEKIDGVQGWYVTDVDAAESQRQGVFVNKKVLISTEETPALDVFQRFIELNNVILEDNIMSVPK
tara:strand:+ start:689 stop:2092 length:1404 start_codon:yes stop_codon:yes gene_type:complete